MQMLAMPKMIVGIVSDLEVRGRIARWEEPVKISEGYWKQSLEMVSFVKVAYGDISCVNSDGCSNLNLAIAE